MDAYKELGKLYEDLGSPEEALTSLEKAILLYPDDVDILFELGRIYRESGKDSKAINVFKKILKFPLVVKDKFFYNKILNELEITEKREILESKLRAMIAMIIDRCNLKCRICGIWKGAWQIRDSIMKEIVNLFPYMEDICWQGGEVFMMKGFDDILQEGTKYKNLKQVIFTNGLLINEKILDKLSKGKIDIVFSIDGTKKETYEYIRYGAKFEKLKKVLTLVREFRKSKGGNIKIYFNPVIMKTNYKELESFIEFAREYEFDAITFTPIRGEWSDENIFDKKDEGALEYIRKTLPKVMSKANEYGIRLNNWLPVEYEIEGEKNKGNCKKKIIQSSNKEGNTRKNRMLCYAPWQRLLLDCNGQVRPFAFCLKKYVGNTDKMSLAEIWNGERMRYYRRKLANNNYKDLCQPECISGQVRDKICKVE